MLRVLVGSPIRQKPEILREFLASLSSLEQTSYTLHFCFIEDNVLPESTKLLEEFAKEHPCEMIIPAVAPDAQYICDEYTHHWKEANVWKIATYKDQIIEKAREGNYDYLFFVDSDLVLHPKTVEQLIASKKDILSNIFWTKWAPNQMPLPQVWVSDHYTLFERGIAEQITEAEAIKRQNAFLEMLRIPGVYQVGGLGACTLISKAALDKEISFQRIYNVSFWGEDRHFCVRAVALGLKLHVDTHYPAYHIYRETDLPGVAEYRSQCKQQGPRITLSMVVRNEEKRYLRRVLESARNYITDAVIIDDASHDRTAEICEEILKDIPLKLIRNTSSKFSNEVSLRSQQWTETLSVNPDWILSLDADEIFEERAATEMKKLAADPNADSLFFRLYDMWDEEHYRSDQYWCAHLHFRPFMIRNRPGMRFKWNEMAQHCGRFPALEVSKAKRSELRLKHYGWAKREDREEKARRYQELDPDAKYGWKEQYDSILDNNPQLVRWTEGL